MKKRIIGIIPARYKSSRLPGKPLVELCGKPMIIWVAELSAKALGKENVYVATEDKRIKEVVERFGFSAVLTSDVHPTGTDRLAEVAGIIEADIYINIQGDEPTLNPSSITKVVDAKLATDHAVINAMAVISDSEDPASVNIPKVVFNEKLAMIYMSRLPVPGYKSPENKPGKYYKQICIYAFNREQLLSYGRMKRKGKVEQCEDIEILRYFELGIPVQMVKVEGNTYAVDVESDVPVVEKRLKEIHKL
jgi:3-deoxy-manno-octulosonate cytidylyltransferase (CMP-KDO synthetase)